MERIERIGLYLIALALAVAVVVLAFKDVDGELDAIDKALGEISKSLSGLDKRVADAVVKRLPAGGCTPPTGDLCPETPCPPGGVDCPAPEVESRYTLLYENARLNEDGEVAVDSFGVKLAGRHRKRLELIASAFRSCHKAEIPVEFEVLGYSSTAEFRVQPGGGAMPNSDDLNRRAANLRAQLVGDYLTNEGFGVTTRRWSPEYDMVRPYRDDAQSGVAQQALNRTVFIDLKSAGECDLGR